MAAKERPPGEAVAATTHALGTVKAAGDAPAASVHTPALKGRRYAKLLPCCLQLRLNKVSELIHNSTHHQDLEMAKVSVHFQEIVDTVRWPYMTCCHSNHDWLCAALHSYIR